VPAARLRVCTLWASVAITRCLSVWRAGRHRRAVESTHGPLCRQAGGADSLSGGGGRGVAGGPRPPPAWASQQLTSTVAVPQLLQARRAG
jgi:hypothetical protein